MTGISLGKVNRLLTEFKDGGLIDDDYHPTRNGLDALDPFKVRSAIVLATDIGETFAPISWELPKDFISVCGEPMIERIIRQLKEAGVEKVVIVAGYMIDMFFYLREKFDVELIASNGGSYNDVHADVYAASDEISSTYICRADRYYTHNPFHSYEYRAYFSSIFSEGDDLSARAIIAGDDDKVVSFSKSAHHQWIFRGFAYWTKEFTNAIKPSLEAYFNETGVETFYWERVAAKKIDELQIYIERFDKGEILIFESLDDLIAYDPTCIASNNVSMFANICRVLECDCADISEIVVMDKGLNNLSFEFTVHGKKYIYRHPGENANGVIDRHKEAKCLRAAKRLGVDDSLVHIDENEGWKISSFVNAIVDFDFSNHAHCELLAKQLKVLHDANVDIGFRFEYELEAEALLEQIKDGDMRAYLRLSKIHDTMKPIFRYLESDEWQVSLCHNDLYEPNLLIEDIDKLYIIDWEFSGDSDIGFDICKLFSLSEPAYEEMDIWLEPYFGRKTTDAEKTHLMACAAVVYYYWYIWSVYAEGGEKNVATYLITWHDRMERYIARALALIEKR